MDAIRAIVHLVVAKGPHGPYAMATSDQIKGPVTFSLEHTVWQEYDWPEEGSVVLLSKLRQKRAGWRAKAGRFTRPSDEQRERTFSMEFLYPVIRQFPFDEVCEVIVRELKERNWQVPGIEVEFGECGSGDQKVRLVRCINGTDYKLYFCRVQGSLSGGRSNTAAVSNIMIPKKQLSVYKDESGPMFYLYVGNDWEKDREQFMNGSMVNSKLNNRAKMYLVYEGGCNCSQSAGASFNAISLLRTICGGSAEPFAKMPHIHPGRRPPLLIHTNDMGREYDPDGNEPTVFQTDLVMEEFRRYLAEEVLQVIVSYPIPKE